MEKHFRNTKCALIRNDEIQQITVNLEAEKKV